MRPAHHRRREVAELGPDVTMETGAETAIAAVMAESETRLRK